MSCFRNRIPCSCLDDKHKEVMSISKMGICCNPRCSLPDRKLERSAMESCEQCRLVHYYSRNCQKKHWKSHKDACHHGIPPELNLFHAYFALGRSVYDASNRDSVRLREQLNLTETRPLRDNENGAKVSETHRRRQEAELEVEVRRQRPGEKKPVVCCNCSGCPRLIIRRQTGFQA